MRARFIPLVTQQNQLMVVIMGGDGSLGQTIRELRKTTIIDEHINKITFCLLPFGTGNDTGQVFGWGSKYFPLHVINIC